MKKTLHHFDSILSIVFVLYYLQFGRISQLFGRIHSAQSVTLIWLAYRIGVVEQCCRMVKYNTNFYKNGVLLHASVHGRRKDFFQGVH